MSAARHWIPGVGILLALAVPAAAPAATFTVTTLNDSGIGSLRDVISVANADTGHDTILFRPGLSGTIRLNGELLVTQPLSIRGRDAARLTISGNGGSRVLRFAGAGQSSLSRLTLTGGRAQGSGGGAIATSGATELTIERSTISGNSAGSGGAVSTENGSIAIRSSTVSGNTATGSGGGVFADSATVIIDRSTVFGNSAALGGGGVSSELTVTAIQSSIVTGNSAPSGPDIGAFSGTLTAGFSLIGSAAGASVSHSPAGSNVVGQSPRLGPLAFNGGPTRTHRPAHASPAIDKGFAGGASSDQRGFARPRDIPFIADSPATDADGADIGAVELQPFDFDFTLGKLKLNRRLGTARLAIRVPGAGRMVLSGRQVRRTVRRPGRARLLQLPIRTRGKALDRLNRRGTARVRIRVTYTPTASTLGPPRTKGRAVRLVSASR